MSLKELIEQVKTKVQEQKEKKKETITYDELSFDEYKDCFVLKRTTKYDKNEISADSVPVTHKKRHFAVSFLEEPEPDPNGGNAIANYLWFESQSFSRALAGDYKPPLDIPWKKVLIGAGIGIAVIYILIVSGFFR